MWKVEPIGLPPLLRAGFTTAEGPSGFQGSRFTFEKKDSDEAPDSKLSRDVVTNYCGVGDDAWRDVHQVHGAEVIECAQVQSKCIEADALWTRHPGLVLAIRTADCVPIIMASWEQPVVAVIHAGWRGTHQNVVAETVRMVVDETGLKPESLSAVIGPCIHAEAFEVDSDVAIPFQETFKHSVVHKVPGKEARWTVDLVEANRLQLSQSGLLDERIAVLPWCTVKNRRFWSHRRQRTDAGRQVAFACLRT